MERADTAGGHTGVELLDTLGTYGHRFGEMVNGLDPGAPVRGSEWTVGETVAHVAAGVEVYATYLGGDPTPLVDLSDVAGGSIAASNARWLAEHGERDLALLTAAMEARLAEIVAVAR